MARRIPGREFTRNRADCDRFEGLKLCSVSDFLLRFDAAGLKRLSGGRTNRKVKKRKETVAKATRAGRIPGLWPISGGFSSTVRTSKSKSQSDWLVGFRWRHPKPALNIPTVAVQFNDANSIRFFKKKKSFIIYIVFR